MELRPTWYLVVGWVLAQTGLSRGEMRAVTRLASSSLYLHLTSRGRELEVTEPSELSARQV